MSFNNKDRNVLIISMKCYIVTACFCYKLHYKLYISIILSTEQQDNKRFMNIKSKHETRGPWDFK